MKKSEEVQKQQVLPEEILKPGQVIQLQKEIVGDGEQITVLLEQIINVKMTWSGEDGCFQHNVFYRTLSGMLLGYDLQTKNWWIIYGDISGQKVTVPIFVFLV